MVPDSQPDPSMLPEQEALRERELGRILRGVIRVRVLFLPVAAVFLTLVVLYDHRPWQVAALTVVVATQAVILGFDAKRLWSKKPYAVRYLPLDLLLMILIQTGVIWLTGGLESPLVVIYLPLGMISGVLFGPTATRWMMIGLICLALWLMTTLTLAGWTPRTVPSFLQMGPGFLDRPIYSLTKAAVITFVVLLASVVGSNVYRAINRMLAQAIGARRELLESLVDRNRELVYLSGAIAHELKNPLASIQGLVQLLDRPVDPERQAARLQVLRKEVGRMRETLDEFLNFSRPLGDLSVKPVGIAGLYDEIASLHEGMAHQKEIEIASRVELTGPVLADPRKLKQALINLLQNALEATPADGRVELLAQPSGGGPILGVKDSGPGLPPELLESATRAGVTSKPGGSGIGLAVARAIAEQHGGRLTLTDRAGGGCRAELELPLTPPAPNGHSPAPAGAARSEEGSP